MYLVNKRCFFFCFAHLQWCHKDGHPIFWVVDAGLAIKILGVHPLWHHRRWAKQKISSFILILTYDYVMFAFYRWDLFVKNISTSFHWLNLNNYTPHENKCFDPRNQNHCMVFVTRLNSVCVQMRHAISSVHVVDMLYHTHWLRIAYHTLAFNNSSFTTITDVIWFVHAELCVIQSIQLINL